MELFENVTCNLCKQNDFDIVYKTKQYSATFNKVDIQLVMCRHCNFVYQNPQLTQSALNKHYNINSSGDIFREYNKDDRAIKFIEEQTDFVSSILSNLNSAICDVGGGSGKLLSNLNTNSKIKKVLIKPSNAILKCQDKNIIKIQKRVEDISLENSEKFELIMCINTLEHFKNPSHVLYNLSNLLKDDGYLFLEVPNSLKPFDTLAEFYSYEHLNHFTYETIIKFLAKCDFYPIKIEESKHFPSIRILAKNFSREKTKNFFEQYSKRKGFFKKHIESIVSSKTIDKISIYATGDHTRFLLEEFNLLPKVEYFIDSDPKKYNQAFYGKTIICAEEIIKFSIKNILISSHSFEKEIYNKIKSISKDINIITIYNQYE